MMDGTSIDSFRDSRQGYCHPGYIASLTEFGHPHYIEQCQASLLFRKIFNTNLVDAAGAYPILCSSDWGSLANAFDGLQDELVSLVAVPDPLGDHDLTLLKDIFPHLTVPYKEHYVVELQEDPMAKICDHHRRNVVRGERGVTVERRAIGHEVREAWLALYGNLISRHKIKGMQAFSPSTFDRMLTVPGITPFCASTGGNIVGIVLCAETFPKVYYHLGAYSDAAYELRASYALFSYIIQYYASAGFAWLSLGSGPGARPEADDGLSRFKRGWTQESRTAYLCGRIFDQSAYYGICNDLGAAADFFPAYRG
jgi:hypothetical protein